MTQDQESADNNTINVLPDRTKPNRPPETKPDAVGVRPGRTTILRVLDNDSDPDGDILTAAVGDPDPRPAPSQSIYGGTGFQITVPADAKPGTETFNYTLPTAGASPPADRSPSTSCGPDENRPRGFRTRRDATTMLVEQGKTVSQNILTDWIDPDGDDLVLMDAKADNDQDQVKVRRDGLLTFQDSGATAGKKNVTVTVWDGRATATGKVRGQRPAARRPAAGGQCRPRHGGRGPGHGDRAAEERRRPQRRRAAPGPGGGQRSRRAGPGHRRRDLHVPQHHPRPGLPDLHRQQRSAKQPGPDPGGRGIRQRTPAIPSPSTTSPCCPPAEASCWTRWPTTRTRPAACWCCSPSQLPENATASVSVIDHSVLRITDVLGTKDPFRFKYTMSNGTKLGHRQRRPWSRSRPPPSSRHPSPNPTK